MRNVNHLVAFLPPRDTRIDQAVDAGPHPHPLMPHHPNGGIIGAQKKLDDYARDDKCWLQLLQVGGRETAIAAYFDSARATTAAHA